MYRGYDQAALDAQYNLRARHPEFQEHFDRWARESEAARSALPCRLDIPYGEGPGERLDWFPAERPGAPVHVFIHGGYWRSLDKKDHSFVAPPLVRAGYAVAVINYALAPSVTVDEIVRQVRSAIAWCRRNAKAQGGDPDRITVSGHSAGGHLTAMALLTDWQKLGLPRDTGKAGCAISGLYEMEPIRLSYLNADVRLDADADARLSPMRIDPPARTPLLVAVGGGETDEFLRQSREYARLRKSQGHLCDLLETPGDNHFTILQQLGGAGTPLARALLKRIA